MWAVGSMLNDIVRLLVVEVVLHNSRFGCLIPIRRCHRANLLRLLVPFTQRKIATACFQKMTISQRSFFEELMLSDEENTSCEKLWAYS